MNIITPTADGSNTLYNQTIGEHYHSKHGALQESKHVFIEAGLQFSVSDKQSVDVLEVGFGTGLNYILSLDYCFKNNIALHYTSIEAFPLSQDVLQQTGYSAYVPETIWTNFIETYNKALQQRINTLNQSTLEIAHTTLAHFKNPKQFDVLYYDAFSVQHQPEMWTEEIIGHACAFIKPGGVFVTYAITGKLKRAVKACGFEIQKLQGAPGKREMLRAIKL